MTERRIMNGVVDGTSLGRTSHGCFQAWLYIRHEHGSQGFGGWALDNPVHQDGEFKGRVGTAEGMQFIDEVLKTLECTRWEDLIGTHLRVDAEHTKIHRIGHILKNQWFDPSDLWRNAS